MRTGCSGGNRQFREQGIALVITLIMLAITLVMAVAFLALAQRERNSVNTTTDSTIGRQAAETAEANAVAQINANLLSAYHNGNSTNAYNWHVFVSTNYINPAGYNNQVNFVNPTNVNYTYPGGAFLNGADLQQNIANLWFLPRAPVFVPNAQPPTGYDFRYYLDLNQNGVPDPNGMQPVISDNPSFPYYGPTSNLLASYQPPVLSNFCVGDPEWIGVLEHPDAPHGPNNHFIARYAFIAVPAGNTLDINYIHNQSQNYTLLNGNNDYYMRNQGVGSWEINLAALLADLNTNQWGGVVGSGANPPPGSALYYLYDQPNGFNQGHAFDDARALLSYRYASRPLASANGVFANAPLNLLLNNIDTYGHGPLQTTFDTNETYLAPTPTAKDWSGANNTNHYFHVSDFFDPSKLGNGAGTFTNRLGLAGSAQFASGLRPTYDRYTFYRMLDQLGSDSAPDDGKLNLNYSNAVVSYVNLGGNFVTPSINIVPGVETNLVPWRPLDFFTAASDQMIRMYTANWYNSDKEAFTNTFAVTQPFSITNIPVWVSNRFVYTPAIHRLLQLAANIYDAQTNGNLNLPHVFRPLFQRQVHGTNNDIFIIGYAPVTYVTGTSDPQLATPYDITQITGANLTPIADANGHPVNVYGVPWIVGAKKNLPSFNQLYVTNTVAVTRKLQYTRPKVGSAPSTYTTNQMYVYSILSGLGISFWNSYTNAYGYPSLPRSVQVYAQDNLGSSLLISNVTTGAWSMFTSNSILNFGNAGNGTVTVPTWPGTIWNAAPPNGAVQNAANCFFTANWQTNFFNSPSAYAPTGPNGPTLEPIPPGGITNATIWVQSVSGTQLPQMYLSTTNLLQAYILDGNNVIDYVQLRDPNETANIYQAMADPNFPSSPSHYWQWSTNGFNNTPPPAGFTYGIYDQWYVSDHAGPVPPGAGNWADPTTFLSAAMLGSGLVNAANASAAEAAYFNAFFTPTPGFTFDNQTFYNTQTTIQAPYTPTRTVFVPFLLQANDPMVHYLGSDLNSQFGAVAKWGGSGPKWPNGVYAHMDNPLDQPFPLAPSTPVGGRYQPWYVTPTIPVNNADQSGVDLSFKDPGAWQSDDWDFPTNSYPTVGWLGRVHRGTPWQTVYLKSRNVLTNYPYLANNTTVQAGFSQWSAWTGDLQIDGTPLGSGLPMDSAWSAPYMDRLLFDIFTTRFNDNSVRGTLPVNQTDLAAWSALLGGMVVLSNSAPLALPNVTPNYSYWIVNPAGPDLYDSALWQIVNGTNGINATRANTNGFPYQGFVHAGDVLATPALTEQSPFLNWTNNFQLIYGINDEEYEWLPQQMMGLVRATEPRYVLYCFGQTLRPAPNGTVLSGNFPQLVTNYQVVAESAIRAVVRVVGATTSTPRVVVESSNVLPPQ